MFHSTDGEKAYILPADSEYFYATAVISNGSKTIAHQPDKPRTLTIEVTDSDKSISAGIITITGKGFNGETVTETLNLHTALTLTGTQIFVTISTIVVAGLIGGDPGDNWKVGSGKVVQITEGRTTLANVSVLESSAQIGYFGIIDGITGTDSNVGELKQDLALKEYKFNVNLKLGLRIYIDGLSSITLTYEQ